jgi:hypothetical protein
MLPRDVQDIIYDFALGLRMVHMMRDVEQAYWNRLRTASIADLEADWELYKDWSNMHERVNSGFDDAPRWRHAPWRDYAHWWDWVNVQWWWSAGLYWWKDSLVPRRADVQYH